MSLAHDLVVQSTILLEPQDPKDATQAAFRRSISTSYYAVFHLLVESASQVLIQRPGGDGLRAAVSRAFMHKSMRNACNAFAQGQHKKHKILSSLSENPPAELMTICEGFVRLQEARHRADYDTFYIHTWRDAALECIVADNLFDNWEKIQDTEDARVFLVALLLG